MSVYEVNVLAYITSVPVIEVPLIYIKGTNGH